MNQPDFAHVETFTTKTKQGTYETPEIIDILEDLPTITNLTAQNMGRLYFDDEGRVINSDPLPEVDKETPNYTKLPVRDDFAVSHFNPLNIWRYWVLIAHDENRYLIRIDFPQNPLQTFDQTTDGFVLKNTPVGEAARYVLEEIQKDNFPPSEQPDVHDDWAFRLCAGLYQDSASFEESNEEGTDED